RHARRLHRRAAISSRCSHSTRVPKIPKLQAPTLLALGNKARASGDYSQTRTQYHETLACVGRSGNEFGEQQDVWAGSAARAWRGEASKGARSRRRHLCTLILPAVLVVYSYRR